MKVQNKVMVVTGGGNGIGRELVLNLLAKGARVAAVDLSEAALQETVELAGENRDKVSTHVVNITDREAVSALPTDVITKQGAVDGLINCAGIIQPFVRVKDLDYDAIERVMNVDFYGMLYMTKEFLPHLLERPEAHITNISSMGGFLPVPGQTVYGAAKAAVKLFTEGLNSELLDTNVRVTVVFPGAIATDIAKHSGVEVSAEQTDEQSQSFKALAPSKAAEIIVNGIENNRYRVLVGSDATFLDRFYRLSPERAAKFIFNKMRALLAN